MELFENKLQQKKKRVTFLQLLLQLQHCTKNKGKIVIFHHIYYYITSYLQEFVLTGSEVL